MNTAIGKSVQRKEAWAKVTGGAQYADDWPTAGLLCARLLTSTHAHARIVRMDTRAALAMPGVHSVLSGADCASLFGPLLLDRPALAREVVRYAGEPVAMVVAQDESTAERALRCIQVQYEPLPVVLSPAQALAAGAPTLHPRLNAYTRIQSDIYPEAGGNVAARFRMRKGDAQLALAQCAVVVRQHFELPPSDHLAMEVRTARAQIAPDGQVRIGTTSQAPYVVSKQISDAFGIPAGQIQVQVGLVGGGFGGKAPVTLEILAYLASRSVGGKAVRLTIPREQDMASAPCRIGLQADITIGADPQGRIRGAQMTYWLDCGAYTDIAPNMTKAIAVDCTGPYRVDNLICDALCVYTNHTYATSYRSFAHESMTFCVERTLDALARRCALDPLELRIRNAIGPGDMTPSQVACSPSLVGDLAQCLHTLKPLAQWQGGAPVPLKPGIVRAQGVACFWKSETPPTDAASGALVSCNADGSFNLLTGVVEIGCGAQTHLAQMLADRLCVDPGQVHVALPVDTRADPHHWKTVASMSEYMAGHAVLRAADDLLAQLRANGAQALGCPPDEVEIALGRVYARPNPERFIPLKEIVLGFQAPDGASLGEPVLGRGTFMLKGLSAPDRYTGKGQTSPAWTLGAQAVEVEADLNSCEYRIIAASTVMDVGCVINPEGMRAMVAGGMAMGISMASREAFVYDGQGVPQAPNLRTYKLMHIGQEPDYRVGFVQTPEEGSPYGVRNYAEHGIIGIPAALGNALSAAFGKPLTTLPLTPERIWRTPAQRQS